MYFIVAVGGGSCSDVRYFLFGDISFGDMRELNNQLTQPIKDSFYLYHNDHHKKIGDISPAAISSKS